MPLTVPTHPVAVLPAKLRWPRRFDGVALVFGCIAPDVAYAVDGYGVTIHSHAWHAPLWWALPLTLVGARLTRWAAPVVAAHLPTGGRLALRDYGVLATVRHPWPITGSSALLGAASHLGWDAFTHPRVDGGLVLFPVLHHPVPLVGLAWWQLLMMGSDLIGAVAAIALVLRVGRARLLVAWHGAVPPVVPRPARFWPAVAAVLVIGLATLPAQPVRSFPDQAIRCLLIVGLALLAGAFAGRRAASADGP
ncbi:MAG: DUF4184 family protein [Dactylosporangium sp.]|nr:DUF4184 family protein [Dactylosporangium sp.]